MNATLPHDFLTNGYLVIDDLIDTSICKLVADYVRFDKLRGISSHGPDGQVPNAIATYADPITEALLLFVKPRLETITKLNLVPTYSYYREYFPGATLERHLDRASCEISVSLPIEYHYTNVTSEFCWPLYVTREAGGSGQGIACRPGGGITYRGCEVEHWRERFVAGPGSYHIQAFLHYVDANGPYAKSCEFDGRPALGLPLSTKDLHRLPGQLSEKHKGP